MATKPEDIKGSEIHLIAQMTAQPGKADSLEASLKAIQVNARSDAEPGCRVYNVLRYGDEFCVVEHYKDEAAVVTHRASEPYQAAQKAAGEDRVPGSIKVKFFAEV